MLFQFAIYNKIWQPAKAGTGDVLWKKEFLKIPQNSQENTCARASFSTKFQGSGFE